MRKAYVGTGVAEKAMKIYVPVLKKKPVRINTAVTADNIMGLFGVVNGTWGFIGRGAEFSANNIGVVSSAASTELTALMQMYSVSFEWLVNAEDPYDRMTITVNGTPVLDATGVQSGSWSGSLNAGDKITFTYTKDVYGDAVGEYAIWKNMVCNVDSGEEFIDEYKARRVLKGYVGDDNGEAQLVFGKRDVSYSGSAGSVTRGERQCAAENKAAVLFAGGYRSWWDEPEMDDVTAFDGRLTEITAAKLSYATDYISGATAGDGDLAVFAGGRYGSAYVTAYDVHLTQEIQETLSYSGYSMCPANFNGYAVFAGGISDYNGSYMTAVRYCDDTLTFNTAFMGTGRDRLASAEVGGKLLLGGGWHSGRGSLECQSVVDVFDEDFTRTETALSVGRKDLAGGAVDGYALFLSGFETGYVLSKVVDAFDDNLTRYTRETLFAPQNTNGCMKAKAIDGMLLVTNGLNMEVWDDTLTALNAGDAGIPRLHSFDVGVIGDYMIIGGGVREGGLYAEFSQCEPYTAVYKVK